MRFVVGPRLGILLLALTTLVTAAEAGGYATYNMSASPEMAGMPAVAVRADGAALVVWQEAAGASIHSRLLAGDLQPAQEYGPGRHPVACALDDGFIFAYADTDTIVLRFGDGETWGAPQVISNNAGTQCNNLDLAPAAPGALSEAYLAWEQGNAEVWFSHCLEGVWQTPQRVDITIPIQGNAHPQVSPVMIGDQAGVRVYYYDEMIRLKYSDFDGAAWSSVGEVPGASYAVNMDAAAGPGLLQHVLSLGPPPSCPCNHLMYAHQLPGGDWALVERVTVEIEEYNWPQTPALTVDADNVAHAHWYQVFHDAEQQYVGEAAYYFTFAGEEHVDRSDSLGGHVGQQNAITLDPQGRAVFAWIEEIARAREVQLCRFVTAAGIDAAPPDLAARQLVVRPAIVAGAATIAFETPRAGRARIDLFDAAGRHRACVADRRWEAGRQQLVWEPDRTAGGRLEPGVYHLRLSDGRESTGGRLLLID